MKSRAISVVALLLFALAGCGRSGMSEQEYADAFKQLMQDYASASSAMNEGAVQGGSNKTLAEQVREDAKRFEPFITRAKALDPPTKFKALNDATVQFFQGQVSAMNEWATAIESGDREKLKAAGEKMERTVRDAHAKVMEEAQKAGAETG